ncbi:MAG: DUF547 domain-containing protein [Alphaproteobacteria bacterium]|nr:DUF547 domain-containing protein [Alphaproteobacteria bacterium]
MAAPRAELWPRFERHSPGSSEAVDHSLWDRILKSYLRPGGDGVNRFDYGRVSSGDRGLLDSYIDGLSRTDIDGLDRPEQLAFWINLYNALTVKLVLDRYPVASIRDINISPGLFSRGPWGRKLVRLGGEELSLDDIEHRILRPVWRDPRIHYAVNCASVGCPNLREEAYRAARIDAQLDEQARAFVNHPRGMQLDGGRLVVSSIYVWFQEDFGGTDASVIAHLKSHAAPDLAAKLAEVGKIDDHRYDWTLNQ